MINMKLSYHLIQKKLKKFTRLRIYKEYLSIVSRGNAFKIFNSHFSHSSFDGEHHPRLLGIYAYQRQFIVRDAQLH